MEATTHSVHEAKYKLKPTQKLNLRILVVEDDQDVASFTRHVIQKNSVAHCEVASDSYEAIQKLCDHKYDLILLDQNLPGMSGTEFLKQMDEYVDKDPLLSESPHFAGRIPVIIMSGNKPLDLEVMKLDHFDVVDFIEKKHLFSRLVDLSA
jgi:CheY-like chemotaxis protein